MKKEPQLKFKSPEDKSLAIEQFMGLKHHPGWQRISAYYKSKIEYIDQVLRGEILKDDGTPLISDINELRLWQKRRNMSIQFMNLPEILVEQMEISKGMSIELDPWNPLTK